MKTDYERLPETVDSFTGVGIPNLTAKLVIRNDKKALYLRSDNIYEVFRIKIAEEEEAFGNHYPKREVYPGNEDFGRVAWTYRDQKLAMRKYNQI
jgi:hypothetical protein